MEVGAEVGGGDGGWARLEAERAAHQRDERLAEREAERYCAGGGVCAGEGRRWLVQQEVAVQEEVAVQQDDGGCAGGGGCSARGEGVC